MKKLALILLLPVLLALGLAVFAPMLASETRLRAEAAGMLGRATGHEAHIEGEVRFHALPWPKIFIEDVRLGEPAGAVLTVPQARIRLDLLPLLTGKASADLIELDAPELVVDEEGEALGRMSMLVAELGVAGARADIRIVDGTLAVRRDGATEPLLTGMNLDLSWRGGRQASASGQVIWRDEPLTVDLRLSELAAMAAGGPGGLRLALSGPPADVSFNGSARLAGGVVAEGALSLSSRHTRAMLEWLGVEAPTERGFGPLSLSAQALLSDKNVTLSQARIDLDGNVSEGGFTLRRDGERVLVSGSFAGAKIDLSPYGKPSFAESDDGEWSRDPLDLSRLHDLDLDLRFSAAEVRAGRARLSGLAASAVLKGGKLTLAIGDASAWKGAFRASVQIAPVTGGADFRVEMAGEDVALAEALGDLFRSHRLEGTGSFHASLAASGASVADLVASLGGKATLTGRQGALVGIDVQSLLSRLEQRPLSGTGDLRGGRTPYDVIDIRATVDDGVAHIERLTLESTKLRVELNGDCDLLRRDLDFEGTAQLVSASSAADFDLPFAVRGSWERPLLLPDPQALIRRSGAARPLFGVASPSP